MSEIDQESQGLARLKRQKEYDALHPHIPPEHIVNGECSFEALGAYLAQHPINTYRAREAAQMYGWLWPAIKAQEAGGQWGLLDIIGEKPAQKPEDKKP